MTFSNTMSVTLTSWWSYTTPLWRRHWTSMPHSPPNVWHLDPPHPGLLKRPERQDASEEKQRRSGEQPDLKCTVSCLWSIAMKSKLCSVQQRRTIIVLDSQTVHLAVNSTASQMNSRVRQKTPVYLIVSLPVIYQIPSALFSVTKVQKFEMNWTCVINSRTLSIQSVVALCPVSGKRKKVRLPNCFK